MGAPTPDRRLESDVGRSNDGRIIPIWRTEFWLTGEMVHATPWTPRVRQAIADGTEYERHPDPADLPDYIPEYRKAQRAYTAA